MFLTMSLFSRRHSVPNTYKDTKTPLPSSLSHIFFLLRLLLGSLSACAPLRLARAPFSSYLWVRPGPLVECLHHLRNRLWFSLLFGSFLPHTFLFLSLGARHLPLFFFYYTFLCFILFFNIRFKLILYSFTTFVSILLHVRNFVDKDLIHRFSRAACLCVTQFPTALVELL